MPDKPRFDYKTIENNIRQLITVRKITQTQLAYKLNMSQSMFNKHLNGHPNFSIEEILNIAQYFHVSIDDLCYKSLSDTPSKKTETNTSSEEYSHLSNEASTYAVCHGLAEIFKHGSLMTETIQVSEIEYRKISDDDWIGSEVYDRYTNALGEDPIHEYNAIYFSNFYPIKDKLEPDEDPDEYNMLIHESDNLNKYNYQINNYLKKLIDLNNIYKNHSIKYEDYCRSIDSQLKDCLKP